MMVDPIRLKQFIIANLEEDVGPGDFTSMACINADARNSGYLLVKDEGVICGIDVAKEVIAYLDPNLTFEAKMKDGQRVQKGDIAFEVSCNTRSFLMAERLLLNTMQRLSGISTEAAKYAAEVADLDVQVLDTRKTTPGMRFLEKYAVATGGCSNYRSGLYDWIMIKDNHIDACGGIPAAITRVQEFLKENSLDLGITVEVRNLEEMHQVLDTGQVTRIMFDNFHPEVLSEGVTIVNGRFETEASGGIDLSNLRTYALTGVNYVSSGALTHSYQSLDLSLKVADRI